ncbi:uncharacterized protein TNCV_4732681 [Trichonephila clavipes]|nr:uncharacterized protein TNCV_4732681 [Trichonephila clavipes]
MTIGARLAGAFVFRTANLEDVIRTTVSKFITAYINLGKVSSAKHNSKRMSRLKDRAIQASVRWDPHALSDEQKATRMFAKCQRQNGNAEEMFQRCHSDGQHFIDHVVTGDETWLHHFVTTSKKATIEWKHPGSPTKKKYKVGNLESPLYSPDSAPSDYFLFPRLKEHLSGRRFSSDSAVKTTAETWLNEQGPDFYQGGLSKLVLRSDKCLNRLGDYVEK